MSIHDCVIFILETFFIDVSINCITLENVADKEFKKYEWQIPSSV